MAFIIFAQASPGDIDPTFGNAGKVIYRFNELEDTFQGVVIQSDGKIVVAGNNGSGRMIVIRYNSNGTLDTSFATGGILTLPALSGAQVESVALQTDGKIVLTGLVNVTSGNSGFLVVRVNSNGVLDTSFDGDGIVSTDLTAMQDVAYDIDIQTDGKLVVTGAANGIGDSSGNIGVVRYNTDGSLDTSFDADGIAITSIGDNISRGYAVKLQTDGKVVVSASANTAFLTQTNLAVLRYLPNGTLDPSFGTGGVSLTPLGGLRFSFGDLAIQADNKIVVLGSVGSNSSFVYDFSVFRFFSNGSPDPNFGTNGRKVIDSGDTNAAQALEIQPDGKIIAVGHSWVNGNGLDILVARLNQDGSFDSSYGNNGKVYTQVGAPSTSDYGWDAALQPDGKLVVVGDFNISFFDYDAVILRFQGDSVIQRKTPFDYDGDGRADISVFRPVDRVWYLNRSTASFSATQFGLSTDKIVPADYDGDGKTDISVFRDGTWYWLASSNGTVGVIQFGIMGDLPVPADYTGDGRAEIAIYRNGVWWMDDLSLNQVSVVSFGLATDKPVAADFDGDGKIDQAVYRGSGEWHLNRSAQGYTVVNFGLATDKPVVGDYDGDGKADEAVYRDGTWYLLQSTNGFAAFNWGLSTDVPIPADYDGDGKTDAAVYRSGTWYLLQSTGGISTQQFGLANDKPTPNAFIPMQ